MSISTPFIRRPVATSLLMAAFVLVGIAAYPLLPVAPLPRVDFPTISVNAKFPGASPDTMAATVAQPLEYQFAQIAGVSQLTSVNVLGQSQITIQFDLDRNIDAAAGDVQAAINAASGQLPKNLPSAPTYRKVNPSDSPIMILSVQSDAVPLINVDDYADNILSQQISQISGVAQVFIGGEQKRAVRVQVDPGKLAAMGLTLEDVRGTLINATADAPKGTVDSAHRTYAIYANDQLTKGSEYNDVILSYRNGAAGAGQGYRPRRGWPGEQPAGWLAERPARDHPGRLQTARRQRDRYGGSDQGGAAARSRPPSRRRSMSA